jgi:hypothetical protein
MLVNGETYELTNNNATWTFIGNAVGVPTPVQPTSFGALKAKYR